MTSKESAEKIISEAKKYGWNVFVRRNILSITKKFTPGDMESYLKADGEYYSILELLRRTSAGSIWGTLSDGIGGMVGLNNGEYVANKSGGDKRVLSALSKMI